MLREHGPTWVAEALDTPEAVRTWQGDGAGRSYFDVHGLNRYVDELNVRGVRGRFDGQSGAGATMAKKAFLISRALSEASTEGPLDAVVLVWDMDQQGQERTAGVTSARQWARSWASFQIVCGLPDPEREAWVLAGFEPSNDNEHAGLEALQRELHFSPVAEAHRLRGGNGEPRDIKRILRMLTASDSAREARCWTETSLATLRERGEDNGLADFLEEIRTILVPLVGR